MLLLIFFIPSFSSNFTILQLSYICNYYYHLTTHYIIHFMLFHKFQNHQLLFELQFTVILFYNHFFFLVQSLYFLSVSNLCDLILITFISLLNLQFHQLMYITHLHIHYLLFHFFDYSFLWLSLRAANNVIDDTFMFTYITFIVTIFYFNNISFIYFVCIICYYCY